MSIADANISKAVSNIIQNKIKSNKKKTISRKREKKNNNNTTKNFGNSIKIYFMNKHIKHDRARWFNIWITFFFLLHKDVDYRLDFLTNWIVLRWINRIRGSRCNVENVESFVIVSLAENRFADCRCYWATGKMAMIVFTSFFVCLVCYWFLTLFCPIEKCVLVHYDQIHNEH